VLSTEDEADCAGDREVIIINFNINVLYKGKSNPITGPGVSRRLRRPDFKTTGT
jgi:hypothetical protein